MRLKQKTLVTSGRSDCGGFQGSERIKSSRLGKSEATSSRFTPKGNIGVDFDRHLFHCVQAAVKLQVLLADA